MNEPTFDANGYPSEETLEAVRKWSWKDRAGLIRFLAAADIQVTPTELLVKLAPLSPPHRSSALAALCHQLNAKPTPFPGTKLALRFAVASSPIRPKTDTS